MKKIITVMMLLAFFIIGGATTEAKTTKKSKAHTSAKSTSSSFNADFSSIKNMVVKFYEGAVIGENKTISWTKSSLSKYLTASCLSKLAKSYREEWGESGYAVYDFRGDVQDSDYRDKVISVEAAGNNSVMVTYTDCGYTCKTRLDLKKEGGTWKINNYKFISQSEKSTYPEWNQYN